MTPAVALPSGIHRKVADVMGEIETLEKRGSFKVDGKERYKFVQATDMYEAIRAKLAERGVSFLASFIDIVSERQDGKLNVVTVQVSLTLTDAETGGMFSALWAGSGQDYGDKAIPKAFTGAVKSWLMTTFLVPSDTDPDDNAQGGRGTRAARQQRMSKEEREQLAAYLKQFIRNTQDETTVRLKLKQLGSSEVQNVSEAVNKLARDKALALYNWLGDELAKRQGAKA